MKIRMKSIAAGPTGIFYAGHVYEVSKEEGESLVKGGYAEEVAGEEPKSEPEKPESDVKTYETATAEPERETARKSPRKRTVKKK